MCRNTFHKYFYVKPLLYRWRGLPQRPLVTINVNEITGNGNKNNRLTVWYIFILGNYKVTHLLKGFPRHRQIRKRTELPVDPENGRQYECERAVHYPYIHLLIGRDAGIAVKRLLTLGLVKCDWLCWIGTCQTRLGNDNRNVKLFDVDVTNETVRFPLFFRSNARLTANHWNPRDHTATVTFAVSFTSFQPSSQRQKGFLAPMQTPPSNHNPRLAVCGKYYNGSFI